MGAEDEGQLAGVVYAVPEQIANNILHKRKNIFVKYTAHQATKKSKLKLMKGMKLYLYISKSGRLIFGEAKIKLLFFLDFNEIISKYEKQLMFSAEQFKVYSRGRENKKAIVMVLSSIRKYLKPVKFTSPVTMGGVYVDSNLIPSKKKMT